ncbi:hypothetical protein TNCV_3223921 [Trichonephila clavipes]|nr:hypothetical protein TNCV_3223921 [Trichonephila clavipes]
MENVVLDISETSTGNPVRNKPTRLLSRPHQFPQPTMKEYRTRHRKASKTRMLLFSTYIRSLEKKGVTFNECNDV